MIQFSSDYINIGTETQINLKPTITFWSDETISYLTPKQRGCYADHEVNLTYLSHQFGYHYEMNNCLIDEGIRDIIWNCRLELKKREIFCK